MGSRAQTKSWIKSVTKSDIKRRGSEFQSVGATTENVRSPSTYEVLGLASYLSEERGARSGWYKEDLIHIMLSMLIKEVWN